MIQKFQSGKYAGKTIGQVACIDYSYLQSIYAGYKSGNRDNWSPELAELDDPKGLEIIVNKLNNSVSQVKCNGCDKHADNLRVMIEYGNEYNSFLDQEVYRPFHIVSQEVLCDEDTIDYLSKDKNTAKKVYPIKFESIPSIIAEIINKTEIRNPGIKRMFYFTKKDNETIHNIFLAHLGFKGRKTVKNCEDFIRNLPQKGEQLGML